MTHQKTFKPLEAVHYMGIPCAPSSADIYIGNMRKAGLLNTSYKLNNRWCITETDIIYIRDLIMKGEYKPSAKHSKGW